MAKKKARVKRKKKDNHVPANFFIPKEEASTGHNIEFVTGTLAIDNPEFDAIKTVMEKFEVRPEEKAEKDPAAAEPKAEPEVQGRFGDTPYQPPAEEKPLSKKEQRKRNRLEVAQLKQLVTRPDVVDQHDVNARDPKLLVFLKAYRNTVAVPKHWGAKRKYLAGKRGIDKEPFQLPDFIAATNISKIRDTYVEKDEAKKGPKSNTKERMKPKMGKMDIDYQVLHDAFFKFMTKPRMTGFGDLYYESKEYECKCPDAKPGVLSDKLKTALGMPDGAPPPWLINMQRYGPPPAYPTIRLPGLNAPIPPGAQFGYHPGGWGKPPVNEMGQPLYGDVFGTNAETNNAVSKDFWGQIQEREESEEEDDEDMEEEAMGEGVESTMPPASEAGLTEGVSSVTATSMGTGTPDLIELRKASAAKGTHFYTELGQQEAGDTGGIIPASHTYAMPKAGAAAGGEGDDFEMSLVAGEEASEDYLKEKYEQAMEVEKDKQRQAAADAAAVKRADKKKKADKYKF